MLVGLQVRELDLSTLQFTRLEKPMLFREAPGLARVGSSVFAFGGWQQGMDCCSCDQYCLINKHWTRVADMHYLRHSFTPCHFKMLSYLISVTAEYYLEVRRKALTLILRPLLNCQSVCPLCFKPRAARFLLRQMESCIF